MEDAILGYAGLSTVRRPPVVVPQGTHPGGEHHLADAEPATAASEA
jgi:hypothetical protein